MKLSDLCSYLDTAVPLSFQEEYDNSGLQVGEMSREVNSALISLDVTEEVVEEAVRKNCDIIISHHPLLFKSPRHITDTTKTGAIVLKAVKNNIAVYSVHTNLDILSNGVSKKLAQMLGLQNLKVLMPLKNRLLKIVTFIPEQHLEKVRNAIFDAGAGVIGGYDRCGFVIPGKGSFRPGHDTNPYSGEKGKIHFEKEIRFETILFSHLKEKVINALLESHPYEEVAYDIYPLSNDNIEHGLGCTGEFKSALTERKFLEKIRDVLNAQGIRYSRSTGRKIRKVALCGGSGSALINEAIRSGADAFVTADIKFHSFFEAEGKLLLVDCGHYESEKFSTEVISELVIKKFPTFAVRFSETNTNPINYL